MTEGVRRRARGPALVVVVLAVAAAAISVSDLLASGARAMSGGRFGPFAGYVWRGPVRSVAADWTVPMIQAESGAGRAGTWIGVEGPAPTGNGPFIQVGVNEERHTPASTRPPHDLYYAFWSDTIHHFHPQYLFTARPGDEISARLALAGGRWQVTLLDLGSNHRSRFSTPDEGRAAFNLAQWLQEDVSTIHPGRVFPYPRLTTIGFHDLLVNDQAPSYDRLFASWMSTRQGTLAPRPLTGDAFTLGPTAISPAGSRYMALAKSPNAALQRYAADLNRWTAATPRPTIRAAGARVARVLARFIAALKAGTWPADARPNLAALIAGNRALLALARVTSSLAPVDLVTWRAEYRRDSAVTQRAAHELVRRLHAPEILP